MRTLWLTLPVLLAFTPKPAFGYIEAPHSLGKCIQDSSNIVVMEVVRINTDKNLLIFKKVEDLKGKHPTEEIKQNIGKRGFHEREWKAIMAWAAVGKKAVFMYSGDASETCIGGYWYQCYRESDWWGMSHGEPFLLRTFVGETDKLVEATKRVLKGEEVVVTCFADGNKAQFHERKGKLQRMKVSLKKQDYNPKRDFVGWGGDGDEIEEFKNVTLLGESTAGWRFIPAKQAKINGETWTKPDFADGTWRQGKAPIGYGEEELKTRKGTEISELGQEFLFRRTFEVPAELLQEKGLVIRLGVASDDNATVYLNGEVIDKDPEEDHEFVYWNREIEVPLKAFKPGRNVLALRVKNKDKSSDLFMDVEIIGQIPLPKKKKVDPKTVVVNPKDPMPKTTTKVVPEPRDPNALVVDKANKTITLACVVAPRKLPQYDQKYPIEVIATSPSPKGQKSHETVFTFQGFTPSDLHKALLELGLKPGKPGYGENGVATGQEVKIYLQTIVDGKSKRIPLEECLVAKNNKPVPPLKWLFTGSVDKQPDPEKDDKVYGADLTGTLLSLFPVTDCCVFQTQMTMKDESQMKLETNPAVLPKEGEAVKLIIVVP